MLELVDGVHEEMAAMREMARSLAEREIAPRAVEIDDTEQFPHDILEHYRQAGFLTLTVPERWGGAGCDLRHVVAVAEELARVDVSAACTFNSHTSCVTLLRALADDEQQERYFGRIAEGALLSMALTEPESGSDAASLRTAGKREGDGYLLNGVKHYCTNADVADVVLVFARTASGSGPKGISVFAVDRANPGFIIRRSEHKMGLHGTTTIEFELNDCFVPAQDQLGPEGEGFRTGMRVLQGGRVAVASIAVGAATGALEHATEHARSRNQFGAAVGSFQGMQFKLADMAIEVEAARQLVAHASEVSLRDERSFGSVSAMAKCFATDVAMRVATEAVQVFGGAGYMRGSHVERVMRDVKVLQIFEGTNEIMRMLVARGLLGSGF